jgi:hypothetical protein
MEVARAMKAKLFDLIILAGGALFPASLFAQGFEVRPYAAYYWPSSSNAFDNFEQTQVLGVRGGYYIGSSFEIGGNWGWINHFEPRNGGGPSTIAGDLGFPQGKVRANIWEAEFSWNHAVKHLGRTLKPYVTGAAGGLTTYMSSGNSFVLNTRRVITPAGNTIFFPNNVISGDETFFTFSYGGGLKAERMVGPLGFFADFRGRTTPNFFHNAYTWPELSAGLSFAWGER